LHSDSTGIGRISTDLAGTAPNNNARKFEFLRQKEYNEES